TRKIPVVDVALLGVAIVWGSSYLTVQDLDRAMPVLTVLALRLTLAGAGLGVLALRRGRVSPLEWRLGALYGVGQAIILYLEAWGVTKTSAAHAGLLISLAIVWTPLYENAALRRWLPGRFYLASLGALLGVGLLVGSNGWSHASEGDLIFLVAALGRTIYFGSLGHVLARSRLDPTRFNAVGCGVSALVYWLVGGAGVVHVVGHLSVGSWAGLIYLAGVSTIAAFLIQTWAIQRTSAARASLLMGTEPVWSTLVAVVIGGETLRVLGIVGALVVVSSTWWGQRIETSFREREVSSDSTIPHGTD
ncbi:MAG: DMT family transporter, partial [Acidimicrobiaceae bacterium]|nr:DMT family transporter [Acidimicrobiaceae bacterium]